MPCGPYYSNYSPVYAQNTFIKESWPAVITSVLSGEYYRNVDGF